LLTVGTPEQQAGSCAVSDEKQQRLLGIFGHWLEDFGRYFEGQWLLGTSPKDLSTCETVQKQIATS
jgi:hypothetical protein